MEHYRGTLSPEAANVSADLLERLAYATTETAPLVAGRRTFFNYRDLGVSDATDGRMRAQVTMATGVMQQTGWHYHVCETQFIFTLRGWIDLQFEDGRVIRVGGRDIPGAAKECSGSHACRIHCAPVESFSRPATGGNRAHGRSEFVAATCTGSMPRKRIASRQATGDSQIGDTTASLSHPDCSATYGVGSMTEQAYEASAYEALPVLAATSGVCAHYLKAG
ncbi:hypothetical protein OKW41_003429 [Paraburkholderia sp. UCT70]